VDYPSMGIRSQLNWDELGDAEKRSSQEYFINLVYIIDRSTTAA